MADQDIMEGFVNSMKSAALTVGQFLTPVLKESKFRDTGVLTPEEFVIAGDHLVHHCPTWSWSKAADNTRTRSYLPENKQFLITRNVPCYKRCVDMEYDPSLEKVLSDSELNDEDDFTKLSDDEGWVDTHHYGVWNANPMIIEDSVKKDEHEEESCNDDEASIDMDAFIAGGGLEDDDPNRFVERSQQKTNPSNDDNIVHTRTYDLNITYDKYYQVPRLWLCGYDERNEPLSVEKMNADFSQDHVNKTVTIELHPHLQDIQMASIHPCRHAEVMKRLMDQLAESGKELSVEKYLLIFLKFVQAVIPTIEYDYTREVKL